MEKNCKACEREFKTEKDDLAFYEKIHALVPNYCPPCREQRRLSFRNERTLYKRNCSKNGKSIISIYPENTPFPVYDQHVWWGDDWDAIDYGMDFDPKRPFFEQLLELRNKVPRISLLNITGINSDYVNNAEDSRNCYLVFAAQKNEDSMYGRLVYRCRFSVDSDFIADSELCYECFDIRKCYNCLFSDNCEASAELLFCFDMRDCQNCIFCSNLRHKSFHIFNQPVSKEEFEAKKKEILSSSKNLEKAKIEFEKVRNSSIVKFAHQTRCYKSSGDYMFDTHEVYFGFDTESSKNCKFVADAEGTIDCWDMNNTYYRPELNLDVMGALQTYNVKHSTYIMYSSHIEYSDSLHHCENCFGCFGLKKKKYCILNKQYSKEEYEKLKGKIIEIMKKEEIYGDFFPSFLSPFGYNETLAQEYYPLTQKEVIKGGFNWQKANTGTYNQETIKKGKIPQSINEVDDSILKEILVCEECNKNFRITQAELAFYRRMHLPLPHRDFECRHKVKMTKRNPRKLWHRKCMKERCTNEFKTSYAPDRPETVYCESCYNKEIY